MLIALAFNCLKQNEEQRVRFIFHLTFIFHVYCTVHQQVYILLGRLIIPMSVRIHTVTIRSHAELLVWHAALVSGYLDVFLLLLHSSYVFSRLHVVRNKAK